MKSRIAVAAAVLLAAGALPPLPAVAQGCSSSCAWGYGPENGPQTWASLCCPVCDGNSQSPIDIRPGEAVAGDLEPLSLAYRESHLEFSNTGRTLEAAYELEDGANLLEIGDRSYSLRQLHFHSLSEHTIDGRHAPIELHLVHQRSSYDIAVVAVLIEEGTPRPAFNGLWNSLPESPAAEPRTVVLDPGKLLPRKLGYFSYRGSLTTPNCDEVVTWYVLREPVHMAMEQIEKFRALFAANYRPTQPLNGRLVSLHEE